MFGAISEKFRTFDMQINFAIPPISHFRRWLGEFFFPFSKLRNFYHFINQLVRKVENFLGISRQSLNRTDTQFYTAPTPTLPGRFYAVPPRYVIEIL